MMTGNDTELVKGHISDIFVQYLGVLQKCATDKEYRRQFEDNPRPILADIGMKIPQDAKIVLESDKRRWPGVFIDSINAEKTERLEIQEGPLKIDRMTRYNTQEDNAGANGEQIKIIEKKETTSYFKPQIIEVETGKTWDENRVAVVIPYFDVEKELYAKIKIENEEVVLTAAC